MTIVPIDSRVPFDSRIYLITGDHPLVIDAGTGFDSDYCIDIVRRYVNDAPLSIVATHCHFDHIGGIRAFIDAFRCEAFIGSRDASFIESGDLHVTVSDMFSSSFTSFPVTPLYDGQILSTGLHDLRIIETPGHTCGSICLYEDSSGFLFSGDTLFSNGLGRVDLPTGSMQDMRRSLSVLSNIDIKGLFPGHGNVMERYDRASFEQVLSLAGV